MSKEKREVQSRSILQRKGNQARTSKKFYSIVCNRSMIHLLLPCFSSTCFSWFFERFKYLSTCLTCALNVLACWTNSWHSLSSWPPCWDVQWINFNPRALHITDHLDHLGDDFLSWFQNSMPFAVMPYASSRRNNLKWDHEISLENITFGDQDLVVERLQSRWEGIQILEETMVIRRQLLEEGFSIEVREVTGLLGLYWT